jgi:SHS2 domain-containing protein
MARYQILKHASDVSVLATGATLTDALASLAEGMFSLIVDTMTIVPRESIGVEIDAQDMDELIVEWLNELLFNYDADGFLPREFNITVDEAHYSLAAYCQGERIDRDRHFLRTEVKAATPDKLKVHHNGEWTIQVVLDI